MEKASETTKPAVYILESVAIIRYAFVTLVRENLKAGRVAEYDNEELLYEGIVRRAPSLLILSLPFGRKDGLELLKRARNLSRLTKIIVLSNDTASTGDDRMVRAGADGLVMKSATVAQMVKAIKRVMAGETVKRDADSIPAQPRSISKTMRLKLLTEREMQVVRLIGLGLRNKEIASELNLSVKTVETHRERIKQKLGFPNGLDLTISARSWAQSAGRDSWDSPSLGA